MTLLINIQLHFLCNEKKKFKNIFNSKNSLVMHSEFFGIDMLRFKNKKRRKECRVCP